MCPPVVMAAAATASAVGGIMNANAQAGAATRNAQLQADEQGRAIRRGTEVSREEFDRRVQRQDELNRLIQGDQRTGFDERMAAERGFIDTQSGARTDALSLYEQALEALGGKRQTAVDEANRIIEAERAAQAEYRQQADTTVDQAIATASRSLEDRQADAARRGELVASTVTAPVMSPVPPGNSVVAADAARQTADAVARATAEGTRAANLNAYGEMPRSLQRNSMTLGDILGGIDLRSGISRSGLRSALTVPRIQVVNAGEDARSQIDRAQTDMEGKIQLGDMLRRSTIGRSGDYENAVVGARTQYGQAADDTSRLYEQRMGVVTGNTMTANIAGGTKYPNTTLGTLLQGIGSIGGAAASGMSGTSWSSLSKWLNPPPGTSPAGGFYNASTGTYGRV